MGYLRDILLSACIAVVLTGLLSMLVPEGAMSKLYRFAAGVFFLLSIVLPFTRQAPSLDISLPTRDEVSYRYIGDIEDIMDKQTEQAVVTRLKAAVEDSLASQGAKADDISINLNKEDKADIFIEGVRIYLDIEYKEKEENICKGVASKLGVVPSIVYN